MVRLRQPLTLEECQQVRIWRNAPDVFPMLRTGYKTEAEQAAFYRDVICNPDATHRYYAVEANGQFVGIGGLTYLDRHLGETEISLVMGPESRLKGYGAAAVTALLDEAFRLGLSSVIGECYAVSPAFGFWIRMLKRIPAVWQRINESGSLEWRWAR